MSSHRPNGATLNNLIHSCPEEGEVLPVEAGADPTAEEASDRRADLGRAGEGREAEEEEEDQADREVDLLQAAATADMTTGEIGEVRFILFVTIACAVFLCASAS